MQPCPNCPPEYTTWSDDESTFGYCMNCMDYLFRVIGDMVHIRMPHDLRTIKTLQEFTRDERRVS